MTIALARISIISASLHLGLPRGRLFYYSALLSALWSTFVGMLSVGLALEAIIVRVYAPFFMITWLIANVAVCFMPIEVLPTRSVSTMFRVQSAQRINSDSTLAFSSHGQSSRSSGFHFFNGPVDSTSAPAKGCVLKHQPGHQSIITATQDVVVCGATFESHKNYHL
ncbi:hypothetical protein ARMGADRAFT_1161622 [Armillaria gallica]|uniref:Uncharacterized protein n=1 Tax=Armillaria gallica TaxID=47427 RepID=A0A2H3EC15_ARMGA|nr:hypothetical protein ARMGADRAFT_1161622 [Armillaria gallica]